MFIVSALLLTAVARTRGVAEHVELAQPAEEPRGTYLKDLSEWHGIEPQWEVLTGEGLGNGGQAKEMFETAETRGPAGNTVNRTYENDYSAIIDFTGYSQTGLCAKYTRSAPIDGHSECPLERDWFVLWPPVAGQYGAPGACFVDEMRAYQAGNTLNSAPGTEVRLNRCPNGEPTDKWSGGYDWRYGGIRPQDNADMRLWPEIKQRVEEEYAKHDPPKKVVVKGYSGGTIASYAFLMSQTLEWRQKHVMAWVLTSPVFGGTIASLHSILAGWKRGAMDRCSGRAAALYVPSVLWMWPRPGESKYFWNRTETIVWTESRNYTAYDLEGMLRDMGLPKVASLYNLEKNDLLNSFAPPMIDTYAFYGYDVSTQAGFEMLGDKNKRRDFSPAIDGPDVCPPQKDRAVVRPWDNGDGVGSLRSTSRAGAWEEAHQRAGIVLANRGYKGMGHSCSAAQCKADQKCVLDKLAGKPHGDC